MPIWHHEMRDFYIEPQYTYQVEVHTVRKLSQIPESDLLASSAGDGFAFEEILILFASVTGMYLTLIRMVMLGEPCDAMLYGLFQRDDTSSLPKKFQAADHICSFLHCLIQLLFSLFIIDEKAPLNLTPTRRRRCFAR
jgi:hypothetical protein